MPRRKNDVYPTPDIEWVVATLVHRGAGRLGLDNDTILEPCAGDGRMAESLRSFVHEGSIVLENDKFSKRPNIEHTDATSVYTYRVRPEWVVTNPPFNQAFEILKAAHEMTTVGVALLLRLTFLEPTRNKKTGRGAWLSKHPPTQIIVLPRMSFTADGKTDSVTCAWMVWLKNPMTQSIEIVADPSKA